MSLLNPGGLWALLALLVVILLCAIRPKFTDHLLPTNFMWKQSLRFQQQSRNLLRLTRFLPVLLQIAGIAGIALILAEPVLDSSAQVREYICVLDNSASMRLAEADGETRFDKARGGILTFAKTLPAGSRLTVITTGDQGTVLLSRCESMAEAEAALGRAECSWQPDGTEGAFSIAQEMLTIYPDAEVSLWTDRDYLQPGEVIIHNTAAATLWNASVTDMRYQTVTGGTVFTGTVSVAGEAQTLPVALYVDGVLRSAKMIECEPGGETSFSLSVQGVYRFDTARLYVDAADALAADNEFIVAGSQSRGGAVQIVSDEPFYLKSALQAFGTYRVDVVSPSGLPAFSGYQIYIYDGWTPPVLPEDGAVWLIDPPQVPAGLDAVLGEKVRGGYLLRAESTGDEAADQLTAGVSVSSVAVLSLRAAENTGSFAPVMMCGDLPALMAGRINGHVPVLWCLFDLHQSNLPLLTDYIVLLNNMLAYSLPVTFEESSAQVWQEVSYTPALLSVSAALTLPDGTALALPEGQNRFVPKLPGLYTLTQTLKTGERSAQSLFVTVPGEELRRAYSGEAEAAPILLTRPSEEDAAARAASGSKKTDAIPYVALILILLICLESVVYYHEQA